MIEAEHDGGIEGRFWMRRKFYWYSEAGERARVPSQLKLVRILFDAEEATRG
jgi:hypothetical protein